MPNTILIIDDDRGIQASFSRALEREGFEVVTADSGAGGLLELPRHPVDLVLLDLNMPDQDGLSVLSAIRATGSSVPVLMISGEGTVENAVKAVQLGALDFIAKPVGPERLLVSVRNALRFDELAQRSRELEEDASIELVGESPVMQQLKTLIEKAAPTEGRILITGENGTGKDLVAQAIHARSRRADGPFIKLNCTAVPAELIESELFGHEKGAFTGAVAARRGRFERADGGTLLLDEVGEMAPAMQAKLLRVLQEAEIERVGGQRTIRVDVRVIAATNRDLPKMVADGEFREDLYYRLNVIHIEMPPLRQRGEDIGLLARRFIERAALKNYRPSLTITDEALEKLARNEFPGNVRELQNLAERLVILADGDVIDERAVELIVSPSLPLGASAELYRPSATFKELSDEAQRRILEGALRHHDGQMTNTARALGMERSHLYKKCKALGVDTG